MNNVMKLLISAGLGAILGIAIRKKWEYDLSIEMAKCLAMDDELRKEHIRTLIEADKLITKAKKEVKK